MDNFFHHSTAATIDQHVDHINNTLISLEAVSSELEDLYRDAREEVNFFFFISGAFFFTSILIYFLID